LTTAGEKVLNKLRIPSFPFPERAIKTLAAMWQWQKNKTPSPAAAGVFLPSEDLGTLKKGDLEGFDLEKMKKILVKAKKNNQATLDNLEANSLMEVLEVPVPPTKEIKSTEDLGGIDFPVVLKLSAPGLLHKADVGGVITNINSEEQLKEAYLKLEEKKMPIQIQKEIDGGVEVILGIKRDPTFGPVMLFGAGGSLAELLNDRNIHLLPISEDSAKKLVEGSKVFPLLNGFRGNLPYDLKPLYEIMQRLAKLVEATPEISEIEINPLKITTDGCWALDPKVILTTDLHVINKL